MQKYNRSPSCPTRRPSSGCTIPRTSLSNLDRCGCVVLHRFPAFRLSQTMRHRIGCPNPASTSPRRWDLGCNDFPCSSLGTPPTSRIPAPHFARYLPQEPLEVPPVRQPRAWAPAPVLNGAGRWHAKERAAPRAPVTSWVAGPRFGFPARPAPAPGRLRARCRTISACEWAERAL